MERMEHARQKDIQSGNKNKVSSSGMKKESKRKVEDYGVSKTSIVKKKEMCTTNTVRKKESWITLHDSKEIKDHLETRRTQRKVAKKTVLLDP